MEDSRRSTPRTDEVLADPLLRAATARLGHRIVKRVAAAALDRCRAGQIEPSAVVPVVLDSLPADATSLHRVVNATGVLVHTNLGRAPLSAAAVAAITVASGPTDVELDLGTGGRDRRGRGTLAALADAVPDAGGVHVVNNGAAALALVTCALAGAAGSGAWGSGASGSGTGGSGASGSGRNVVVARGEMVEIGDGFRIPELLESMGATLREVGTTNRVRRSDYEAAVDADTGFVLKVHPSNFVVSGFTSTVAVAELAALRVPVVADIGSGLLTPHPRLPDEPDAASTLRAGATLVTASGDKLLGGPQCGLLLGDAGLVDRLRRHPFARAVRVDKLTLAALEATLTGPTAPVASALEVDPAVLLRRAEAICGQLTGVTSAEAVTSSAAVGGGGAPGVLLPSAAVSVDTSLADPLRAGNPPVVGHVQRGRLLLDLVAVPAEDDDTLVEAVRRAAKALPATTVPAKTLPAKTLRG